MQALAGDQLLELGAPLGSSMSRYLALVAATGALLLLTRCCGQLGCFHWLESMGLAALGWRLAFAGNTSYRSKRCMKPLMTCLLLSPLSHECRRAGPPAQRGGHHAAGILRLLK